MQDHQLLIIIGMIFMAIAFVEAGGKVAAIFIGFIGLVFSLVAIYQKHYQ